MGANSSEKIKALKVDVEARWLCKKLNFSTFISHLITSLSRCGWWECFFFVWLSVKGQQRQFGNIVNNSGRFVPVIFLHQTSPIPLIFDAEISTSHIRIPKIEKWQAQHCCRAHFCHWVVFLSLFLYLCATTNLLLMKRHWAPAKKSLKQLNRNLLMSVSFYITPMICEKN